MRVLYSTCCLVTSYKVICDPHAEQVQAIHVPVFGLPVLIVKDSLLQWVDVCPEGRDFSQVAQHWRAGAASRGVLCGSSLG